MHKSGHDLICPVVGLQHIRKASKQLGYTASLTGDIRSQELSNTIKAAAIIHGFDARDYSTHSVRIGGATALLNSGVDSLAIKLLGRWLSSCFEEYPVQEAKGTRGLSKAMVA